MLRDRFNRRSFVTFSLRTLLLLVTIVCLALGWREYDRRQSLLADCATAAETELLARHWSRWYAGSEMNEIKVLMKLQEEIASELRPRSRGAVIEFLVPPGGAAAQALTAEEIALLKEWSAAVLDGDENRIRYVGRGATYYQPVLAQTSCATCHNAVKPGQLMALTKVEMTR